MTMIIEFLRIAWFLWMLTQVNRAKSVDSSSEGVIATSNYLGPVPYPLSQKSDPYLVCLAVDFSFKYTRNDCPLIRNYARGVYESITDPVLSSMTGKCETVKTVFIVIFEKCLEDEISKIYPHESMDESYVISAISNDISIYATQVWGAMRGLETLAQLVFKLKTGQIALFTTSIKDQPRFKYRGLLLDTSRHYLDVSKLVETLKLMAIVKFNVFHWHIVDDPSFPYSSYTFPDMAEKGAFNPQTRIYTQQDVADVIEAGRRLGIRVIPEFDTPGHTQSWGESFPNLLAKCYSGEKPNGNFGPIDPSHEPNYNILSRLFREVMKVFPDNFLHLGGDEVMFDCWKSNPNINSFMKKMKIKSYTELESYYINRLLTVVNSARPVNKNITTIIWQEVFDNRVQIPPNVLIHVWKDHTAWEKEMAAVTKAGYTAILSSCWYLNYISYGTDFPKYYNCDPQNFNGTPTQKKLVYGGEACMWGEYVDNTNVISRTWPRVASVAEALWTSSSRKDINSFTQRIQGLQCRMRKRGYGAQDPNGPSTCARPFAVAPGV